MAFLVEWSARLQPSEAVAESGLTLWSDSSAWTNKAWLTWLLEIN
jgi:hypothetical protein